MKNICKNIFIFLIFVSVLVFVSCEEEKDTSFNKEMPSYKDGSYYAKSIKDGWGGYADITIEIKDGKIVSAKFVSYDQAGNVKDENYGKEDGKIKNLGLYRIAQNSVAQANKYGDILVEKQVPENVDILSGATISFKLFQDAAKKALEKAL